MTDFDFDLFVRAQRVGEHVTRARGGDVAGLDLSAIDEHLRVGVILGETVQATSAQQIRA